MLCTDCKKEVTKLHYAHGEFICSGCFTPDEFRGMTWQNASNPYKPWLTKAEKDVFRARIISPDDNRTVIDRRTGKETPLVHRHR